VSESRVESLLLLLWLLGLSLPEEPAERTKELEREEKVSLEKETWSEKRKLTER